jgi:SAM-dependent methyltransferase
MFPSELTDTNMSNETSKSHQARADDYARYFHGRGLDIGCGADKLTIDGCQIDGWDLPQGDAQFLDGIEFTDYDFVYSSHCLEHMVDVETALFHWSGVIRPDGILYIVVPDFLLYEQGVFPSRFNGDHKQMFTLFDVIIRDEQGNRPPNFFTVRDMVSLGRKFGLELIDSRIEAHGYDFTKWLSGTDQTLGHAMAQCVFVFRKK